MMIIGRAPSTSVTQAGAFTPQSTVTHDLPRGVLCIQFKLSFVGSGKRRKRSKSLTQADGEAQKNLAKDLRTSNSFNSFFICFHFQNSAFSGLEFPFPQTLLECFLGNELHLLELL